MNAAGRIGSTSAGISLRSGTLVRRHDLDMAGNAIRRRLYEDLPRVNNAHRFHKQEQRSVRPLMMGAPYSVLSP